MKNTNQYDILKTITALIMSSQGLSDRDKMVTGSKNFIKTFDTMCKSWGTRSTLLYFKEVRLAYTRYLSGSPISPRELSFTIGLTREGIPKMVKEWIPIIRRGINPKENRILMTLLTIGRLYQVPVKIPDLASIIEENETADEVINDFEDDFVDFIKKFQKKYKYSPKAPSFEDYYMTLSYGPNGPALRSSLWEVKHLPAGLTKLINEVHPGLSQRIDFLKSNVDKYPDWDTTFNLKRSDKFRFGKLVAIPDKEGKTRIVTSLNYWAQCSLKPLHDEISNFLKMLPYDCTHNQGNFKTLLSVKSSHKWHSIDLKDATDRFPRKLQEIVIRTLYGKQMAKLWNYCMTQELTLGWDPDKTVKFGTGQPMGAYSSFPSFALTHGLLVSYLADMLDVEEDCFRILGDDIVIRHDDLAGKYKRFLTSMNIPFSITKTMESVHTFEFAKRWFHHGVEISPFPTAAVHESMTSFPGMSEAFRTAGEKGWDQNFCTGPGLVRTILSYHGTHKIFIRKFIRNFLLFTSFPSPSLTDEVNLENWVTFLRLSGQYVSCVGWRDHCQSTLNETLRKGGRELLFNAIRSLAQQSDDLWRCLYYAGLSPSRGINADHQKVLEWANPLLAVLRKESDKLDLPSVLDQTSKDENLQKPVSQFLKDFALIRVFSLDNLKKDRTNTIVLKARAKLMQTCHKNLLKLETQ